MSERQRWPPRSRRPLQPPAPHTTHMPGNPSYTEMMTSTMANRSRALADNFTKNSVVIAYLKERDNIRKIDGGATILEEVQYGENPNFGWYSGYDILPTSHADTMTSAEFSLKQCSVQVLISGTEKLQNSGKEKMFDLMEARIKGGEKTMMNRMGEALWGDGTAFGGKAPVGLNAIVPVDPTVGVYGGIDRAQNPWWRPVVVNPGLMITSGNILGYMEDTWVKLVRNNEKPDLIVADDYMYRQYWGACQAQQRLVNAKKASMGFEGLDFNGAMVVHDGGVGGYATAKTMFFLNTEYLFYRPHKDREFEPITPGTRAPTNQDAEVVVSGWAGAFTNNNQRLQGRLISL